MNGSRGRSNNFLLDGTDMNDGYRNDPAINEAGVFGDPATILPIDAVAELNVLSNYEAGIRPQQRRRHQHRDQERHQQIARLGARILPQRQHWTRATISTSQPDPKSPFNNNQFGGSLGGPIVKDKTFFYVDYEGQRENGAQAGVTCVPDPAVASQCATEHRGLTATRVSPIATALLARNPWPTPNISGAQSAIPKPVAAYGQPLHFHSLLQSRRQLHRQDRPEFQRRTIC